MSDDHHLFARALPDHRGTLGLPLAVAAVVLLTWLAGLVLTRRKRTKTPVGLNTSR